MTGTGNPLQDVELLKVVKVLCLEHRWTAEGVDLLTDTIDPI